MIYCQDKHHTTVYIFYLIDPDRRPLTPFLRYFCSYFSLAPGGIQTGLKKMILGCKFHILGIKTTLGQHIAKNLPVYMDGCPFERRYHDKDMIRCSYCATWVHIECVKMHEEYIAGFWSCFECRRMPAQISEIQTGMTDVINMIKTLMKSVDKLHREQNKIKSELKEKDEQISKLSQENADLKVIIGSITQNVNASHWQAAMSHATQNSLLIGSSIIRDVDENKLLNTKCVCISGGHISDIKEAIAKLPTTRKLHRIVLVVGGNDCEGRDNVNETNITDILSKYEELIKCAKEVSSSVAVSSVCARNRGDAVAQKISSLNAGLKVTCDDIGAEFIDNDPSFYLQDGTINDRYLLPDSVHLSRAATNKLVSNLKLQLRHGETSAHHSNRCRWKGNGTPASSPGGDDCDLQHTFWQRARQKVNPHRSTRQCRLSPTTEH